MPIFKKGRILPMINDIQKANMWKRISAYIFDTILLLTVVVGIAFLLSTVLKYDANIAKRHQLRADYEMRYGVDFDIAQADYDALSEEERKVYDDAYAEFATSPEVNSLDVMIVNLTLIITVFSFLASFVIFELLIPLGFGNGQTLGKKIFGICVMRVDSVKINTFQLFVRSILGKYTLETMIPIFLMLLLLFNVMPLACAVGIFILFIVQIGFSLFTQLRTPIHDAIAGTVTVDFASQMIFDSTEDMLEYKKRIHAEEAERAKY